MGVAGDCDVGKGDRGAGARGDGDEAGDLSFLCLSLELFPMPNVFFRKALKPVGFGEDTGEAAGPLVFAWASGDRPRVAKVAI